MSAQYEYLVQPARHEHGLEFQEHLNEEGAKGWLLVGVFYDRLVFVREKAVPTSLGLLPGTPQPIEEGDTSG